MSFCLLSWTRLALTLFASSSLVYPEDPPPNEQEVPEDTRKRAVTYSDPVHTFNLGQFVQYHLQKAVAGCGGEARFQEEWLVNVDKDVLKSFGRLGIM